MAFDDVLACFAAAAAAVAAVSQPQPPPPRPPPPKPKTQQVSAWRSRGRLPLGVDATAAFIEAEIE